MQMDNLRGLLGIRRMDRVTNARIRVMKVVDKRIDESVLQWFLWTCTYFHPTLVV